MVMRAVPQLIDDAATIASELAELCRSRDIETLLFLFDMAAAAPVPVPVRVRAGGARVPTGYRGGARPRPAPPPQRGGTAASAVVMRRRPAPFLVWSNPDPPPRRK